MILPQEETRCSQINARLDYIFLLPTAALILGHLTLGSSAQTGEEELVFLVLCLKEGGGGEGRVEGVSGLSH